MVIAGRATRTDAQGRFLLRVDRGGALAVQAYEHDERVRFPDTPTPTALRLPIDLEPPSDCH